MKITMYELLGMMKDSKAPKKIKYENCEYYLYDDERYITTDKRRFFNRIYFCELNNEVEILEEKKIPEKLQYNELLVCSDIDKLREYINEINKEHYFKINEIIDYLKSKGDE